MQSGGVMLLHTLPLWLARDSLATASRARLGPWPQTLPRGSNYGVAVERIVRLTAGQVNRTKKNPALYSRRMIFFARQS